MAPPLFADLGKEARDIFSKGFGFGSVKLDIATKAANGVEFNSGVSSNDAGKVSGSLETTYKNSDYGLTFKEKWNSDNILTAEMTIEDQIASGLKLTFDTMFAPNTSKKVAKIKTAYKQDNFSGTTDIDFDFTGPTLYSSAVVGYKGWLLGGYAAYDTSKSRLVNSKLGIAYKTDDFVLHSSASDNVDFSGSYYQKVSDKVECAASLGWTAGTAATKFAIGGKYVLDSDSSVKMRVGNDSQVGFGYTQQLRDGVKLTLSALIDAKNLNQAGHKLGLGLDVSL